MCNICYIDFVINTFDLVREINMGFDYDERLTLYIVACVCSSFSILGCSFICLVYYYYKELRAFSFKLVMYLAISDLFNSTIMLIPWLAGDTFCKILGMLNNFSALVSITWTLLIAVSLYSGVIWNITDLEIYERKMQALAYAMPAVLSFLP